MSRRFRAEHAPAGAVRRLAATKTPRGLAGPAEGRLRAGGLVLRCALGSGGVSRAKREGDGASPAGSFRLLYGYYRADRLRRPRTALPLRAMGARDGWCDDPAHPAYNRPVRLPFAASCESMRREDGLYDLVLVLDYNLRPRRRGRGSAIFLHCAREDFSATQGCVALRTHDLLRLLPRLSGGAVLTIA
ncbi:L,D-transpeptidase [Methylocella sp.]|uniref:L,D-transpeptidase n=1 Tax=Methylocella sp. TaxID=1978226 RepID=UPI00378356FB